MKRVSIFMMIILAIFSKCRKETNIETTLYYNAKYRNLINELSYTKIAIDSFLIKEWKTHEIDGEEIKGNVIMVNYLNFKPVVIKSIYVNNNDTILRPFNDGNDGNNKFTHVKFEQQKNNTIITKHFYDRIVPFKLKGAGNEYFKKIEINNDKLNYTVKFYNNDGKYFYTKYKYNKDETDYYDYNEDNTPYLRNNFYMIKELYNEDGLKTEQHFFTYKSGKTVLSDNIPIFKYKYDNRGNLTVKAYYNRDNKLTMFDGIAITKNMYDEHNNLIEMSNYDQNEKLLEVDGYAIIRNKYDTFNNLIETKSFGKDEKLIMYEGYAILKKKYDKFGNVIELATYDTEGNPVISDGGAITKIKYDTHGNLIEIANYDAEGKLMLSDGFAILKINYNDKENIKEQIPFDTEGNVITEN